ncbi:MAG: nitroreductase family protein [Polyangiaceae bacterium]|nr:nitroreductase family protein [Polyangiaceae bacterium]
MNEPFDEKLSLIFGRRSIRSYAPTPVPDEMVTALLRAAMAAPSACAKDPWRFVVLRSQTTRERIAGVLPNGKMLGKAPVGIAVLGDLSAAHGGELSYLLQDCSAAIQNLLLAAHALGLGACWLGVHPRQDRIQALTEILRLPESIVPVSCVALGYPAERKSSRTRFSSAFVHDEAW